MLVEKCVIKAVEDKVCIEVDCGGRMGLKSRKVTLQQLKYNRCRACRSRFANTLFEGTNI